MMIHALRKYRLLDTDYGLQTEKMLLAPLLGAFMLLILTGGLLLFRYLQISFGERATAKNLEMIPPRSLRCCGRRKARHRKTL